MLPSGARPRHGVKTWRRVDKRILSDIKAVVSFCGPFRIGCMLRRYERRLHILVKMTKDVEAVGYECVRIS
jgi:hypothetical protein